MDAQQTIVNRPVMDRYQNNSCLDYVGVMPVLYYEFDMLCMKNHDGFGGHFYSIVRGK